jgi:soluble lytic murein transglycosylase-like protein
VLAGLTFSCVLALLGGRPAQGCETPYLRHIASTVVAASHEFRVPADIIVAVINHESKFRQYTVGSFHELGLMQIKRRGAVQGDWAKLSDHDLSDVTLKIWMGTAYLSKFVHKCRKARLYLTPYNGGKCVPSAYSDAVLEDLRAARRWR